MGSLTDDVVEADRGLHVARYASVDVRVAAEVEYEEQALLLPYPQLAGRLARVRFVRWPDLSHDPGSRGVGHVYKTPACG